MRRNAYVDLTENRRDDKRGFALDDRFEGVEPAGATQVTQRRSVEDKPQRITQVRP